MTAGVYANSRVGSFARTQVRAHPLVKTPVPKTVCTFLSASARCSRARTRKFSSSSTRVLKPVTPASLLFTEKGSQTPPRTTQRDRTFPWPEPWNPRPTCGLEAPAFSEPPSPACLAEEVSGRRDSWNESSDLNERESLNGERELAQVGKTERETLGVGVQPN